MKQEFTGNSPWVDLSLFIARQGICLYYILLIHQICGVGMMGEDVPAAEINDYKTQIRGLEFERELF